MDILISEAIPLFISAQNDAAGLRRSSGVSSDGEDSLAGGQILSGEGDSYPGGNGSDHPGSTGF